MKASGRFVGATVLCNLSFRSVIFSGSDVGSTGKQNMAWRSHLPSLLPPPFSPTQATHPHPADKALAKQVPLSFHDAAGSGLFEVASRRLCKSTVHVSTARSLHLDSRDVGRWARVRTTLINTWPHYLSHAAQSHRAQNLTQYSADSAGAARAFACAPVHVCVCVCVCGGVDGWEAFCCEVSSDSFTRRHNEWVFHECLYCASHILVLGISMRPLGEGGSAPEIEIEMSSGGALRWYKMKSRTC